MTFLEKIKAILGLGEASSDPEDRDVGVTVEREPSAGDRDDTGASADGVSPDAHTEANGGAAEAGSPDDTGDEDRVPSEAVDVIKGIGPTYADRLSNEGIETVADLSDADAESVAERADVPQGRLEDWIERAKNRSR